MCSKQRARFAPVRALYMTRQPVCRGQPCRASSRNLAASSSGECLGAVDVVWCVRDTPPQMMCAPMCWCSGYLVVRSNFYVGFYYVFFSLANWDITLH